MSAAIDRCRFATSGNSGSSTTRLVMALAPARNASNELAGGLEFVAGQWPRRDIQWQWFDRQTHGRSGIGSHITRGKLQYPWLQATTKRLV